MAANANDKLIKGARRFSTTLAATIADGAATSMSLTSTTGLPTDTAVELVIDRVDANGNKTPSKEEVVRGVVSGTSVINLVRGVEGTAQGHSAGAVVEARLTADQWNRMVDWGLTEHAQDGTHDSTKVAMLAGAQTFTGAKTFGSGLLKATRPQITTSIDDANGNEVIETPATPSAVNQVKITNAATGNNPTIEASGDDTTIPLFLKGKSASVGVEGIYDNGNITGSVTINMKKGSRQKATLTGNVTLNFSNPVEGQALELFLIQDATGGRTISFTPTINWQDNTTPTWTTTADKVNVIVLRYIGTSWYGIGAKFA
jgi:hypothetical protein